MGTLGLAFNKGESGRCLESEVFSAATKRLASFVACTWKFAVRQKVRSHTKIFYSPNNHVALRRPHRADVKSM